MENAACTHYSSMGRWVLGETTKFELARLVILNGTMKLCHYCATYKYQAGI